MNKTLKEMLAKGSAFLGMIVALVALFYLVKGEAYALFPDLPSSDPELTVGNSRLVAMAVSLIGMVFYAFDAIVCVLKAVKNKDRVFNSVLATAIFVGAVSSVIIFRSAWGFTVYICWMLYYYLLFAAEVVSVVRCTARREVEKHN